MPFCQLARDTSTDEGHVSRPYFSVLEAGLIARKRLIHCSALILFASSVLIATAFSQAGGSDGTFSDLSADFDGGVAHPTDGSTGHVLQQALFAAHLWGVAHGARATVVVSSDYPIRGSRILVPGNVDLVCSSYTPRTYMGGCAIVEGDPGDDTATGGSPLLMVDFTYGLLPDGKTLCSVADISQTPGCTIINGSGASIRGFSLYGAGRTAGGADVGIRVAADNVSVEDTSIAGSFGGPGLQNAAGRNNSFHWNYGTDVNTWWCAHPGQLTAKNLKASLQKSDSNLGAIDLMMTDGEAKYNRYSSGCAASREFTASLEYPHLAAMNVGGSGNVVEGNLLQSDEIGLIVSGQEQQITKNRVAYQAREAIRSIGIRSIFLKNDVVSACLDPNLAYLRPGSLDGGTPRYPSSPTFLYSGYIIKDPNGNIEQVVHGRPGSHGGMSDESSPEWPRAVDGTLDSSELTWENIGSWRSGLRSGSFVSGGPVPALVNGMCYAVTDFGQGNVWDGTRVAEGLGVGGRSYVRGDYFMVRPSRLENNRCDRDWPDAYGNGQCWWGIDLYANGGPATLASNGRRITSSGGGTAWLGDYSVLELADLISRHYNNFQGMADGQSFWVTSSNSANVIDARSESQHGMPAVQTCTGGPMVIWPGRFYEFHYDAANGHRVTQVNCSPGSGTVASSELTSVSPENAAQNAIAENTGNHSESLSGKGADLSTHRISVLPRSLIFASQIEGTTSVAQKIAITNPTDHTVTLLIALLDDGDFVPDDTCIGSVPAGSRCTISVRFRPSKTGMRAGTLTVTDLNGGYSEAVTLTGSGTPQSSSLPTFALSSSAASLEVNTAGGAATSEIDVTAENGFQGQVNLQCAVVTETKETPAGLPACSLSTSQVTISSENGSSSKVSVFTHTTATAESAALSWRRATLAGLAALLLLPWKGWQKRIFACLCLWFVGCMTGCGYVPNKHTATNTPSIGMYKLVVTATAGLQSVSLSIPLKIQ